MEARLGEESDVVTNAFFRQAPSRAMRSSAGVCSHGSREPHEVVAVVVAEDEDDVARFFAVAGDRDRSGRLGCRLRNGEGCETCGQRDSFQVHHGFMIVI